MPDIAVTEVASTMPAVPLTRATTVINVPASIELLVSVNTIVSSPRSPELMLVFA